MEDVQQAMRDGAQNAMNSGDTTMDGAQDTTPSFETRLAQALEGFNNSLAAIHSARGVVTAGRQRVEQARTSLQTAEQAMQDSRASFRQSLEDNVAATSAVITLLEEHRTATQEALNAL